MQPTVDDVRAALEWAIAHDKSLLLAYRDAVYRQGKSRHDVYTALVARWRSTTGGVADTQVADTQEEPVVP